MIPLNVIYENICLYFNVDKHYPLQRDRKVKRVYIRQMFHFTSRKVNGLMSPYDEIACHLKEDGITPFDHATVMNSCKKIENYISYDKSVLRDFINILNMLPKDKITNIERIKPYLLMNENLKNG